MTEEQERQLWEWVRRERAAGTEWDQMTARLPSLYMPPNVVRSWYNRALAHREAHSLLDRLSDWVAPNKEAHTLVGKLRELVDTELEAGVDLTGHPWQAEGDQVLVYPEGLDRPHRVLAEVDPHCHLSNVARYRFTEVMAAAADLRAALWEIQSAADEDELLDAWESAHEALAKADGLTTEQYSAQLKAMGCKPRART